MAQVSPVLNQRGAGGSGGLAPRYGDLALGFGSGALDERGNVQPPGITAQPAPRAAPAAPAISPVLAQPRQPVGGLATAGTPAAAAQWYDQEKDPQVRQLLSKLSAGKLTPQFASDIALQFASPRQTEETLNQNRNIPAAFRANTNPYLVQSSGDPSGWGGNISADYSRSPSQGTIGEDPGGGPPTPELLAFQALQNEYPYIAPKDNFNFWTDEFPQLAGVAICGIYAPAAGIAANVGSAAGAAIGNEVGGPEGAQVGGLVGGAAGGFAGGDFAGSAPAPGSPMGVAGIGAVGPAGVPGSADRPPAAAPAPTPARV